MQNDCLRNYLKNIKNIAIERSYEKPLRVVVGNQGCDPDSIIGALTLSLLKTLEDSPTQPNFSPGMQIFTSQPSALNSQDDNLIIPWIPLINCELNRVKIREESQYLDRVFGLGLEEIGGVEVLGSGVEVRMRVALIDHNYPEMPFSTKFPNIPVDLIIDHHNIVDKSFLDKVEKKIITPSASACSVLIHHYYQENRGVLEQLCKLFPQVIMAAMAVIYSDAEGFKPQGQNLRWFQFDHNLLFTILPTFFPQSLTLSDLITHNNNMISVQYGDRQFDRGIEELIDRDCKSFWYLGKGGVEKVKILYCVLRHRLSTYFEHFPYPQFLAYFHKKIHEDNYKAVIVMALWVGKDDWEDGRDTLVYSEDEHLLSTLKSCFLARPSFLTLVTTLTTPGSPGTGLLFLNPQSNVSRKIAEGWIREAIEGSEIN